MSCFDLTKGPKATPLQKSLLCTNKPAKHMNELEHARIGYYTFSQA